MAENNANTQIRIKDIAELAGVSPGTVDRVLHHRGEVSTSSKEKVEKVLKDLNYKPNIYASALAFKRKKYHFTYLIPFHTKADYWAEIENGLQKAATELASINMTLTPVYFDQYNSDSFVKATKQAIGKDTNGILLAPIFLEEAKTFVTELNKLKIPFAFYDSLISCDQLIAYFGQDSFLCGKLAGRLVSESVPADSEILLFYSKRSGNRWSTQSASRRNGFIDYIEQSNRNYSIKIIEIPMQDEYESKAIIAKKIQMHPNAQCAIIFNSRSYLIGESLKDINRQNLYVLGFDAIQRNIACLKEGTIKFLIAQQPQLQGYRSVKSLCESAILKQPIKQLNYMPLDILSAENVDFYTEFEFL